MPIHSFPFALGPRAAQRAAQRAAIVCATLPLWAGAAPLPDAATQALRRAQVPASALSVVVAEVGPGAPRLSWQPDVPRNAASLMKLYTAYAGLSLLGPAYTWSTPVWVAGTVRQPGPDGVLEGNLHVQGSGDPKLVMERVWLLLKRVQQWGIRDIRGDIVVDRSRMAEDHTSPAAFDEDPGRPYNVRPDALLLNFKALTLMFRPDPARGVAWVSSEPVLAGVEVPRSVALSPAGVCGNWRQALRLDFSADQVRFGGALPAGCGERRWAVAYPQPEAYNARALAGLWRDMGGRLSGTVREGPAPADQPPSFVFESPPLADAVRDMNKYSSNVMADLLFLTLGQSPAGAEPATPESARATLMRFVRERTGCEPPQVLIDNGSGLSRDSRTSAACLARLLQSAWASPVMPELLSSLPVTGTDGTVRKEGEFGSALGRAHLKTGSLKDATGLAGVVLGRSGRRYVFVGIVNHGNAPAARGALEALVQWTADD